MTALERRYRKLLRAYPDSYREQHGEEIIATLLDVARDGQRWPAPREMAGLARGALRARSHAARQRPTRATWLGGLRLAVLFLLAQATASLGAEAAFGLTAPRTRPVAETVALCLAAVLCTAALLTTAAGRYVLGLAGAVTALAAHQVSVFFVDLGGLGFLQGVGHRSFWPLAVAVVAGASLIWCRPAGGRAWPWLPAILPALVLLPTPLEAFISFQLQPWGFAAVILGCLLCAAVDPRIPIGAAGLTLAFAAKLVYAVRFQVGAGPDGLSLLTVTLLLTAALLAAQPVGKLVGRPRLRQD
jgi:hypothetical protein